MATSNPCCSLHFTCVACPIITGPDCQPPNNMAVGQLWFNPCTCTYYFQCSSGFDEDNSCEGLTPINYKAGAGIAYSGDCENGSFISVRIEVESGLAFTETGNLTIDCAALINHCELWYSGNCLTMINHCGLWAQNNCEEMIEHCELWTRNNLQFDAEEFNLECDPETGVCTLSLVPPIPTPTVGDYHATGARTVPGGGVGTNISFVIHTIVMPYDGFISVSASIAGQEVFPDATLEEQGVGVQVSINGQNSSARNLSSGPLARTCRANAALAYAEVSAGQTLTITAMSIIGTNITNCLIAYHYISYTP